MLITCPVCAAAIPADHAAFGHIGWHEATGTLGDWTARGAVDSVEERTAAARRVVDDAPTAKLPPVGQTIRRRPPVPPLLDPGTPAMLRALAAAMEDDGLPVDQLGDDL